MMKHTVPARRLVTPAVIAAVVFVVDQLTKAWVLRTWPQPYSGDIPIIDRWLELTYVQNTGVAFGLFEGMPQVFTVTSLLIVAAAIWIYLRHVEEHEWWMSISLGLIVGGAIGNVVDRIRFGYVVDFIKTFDGRFAVFNIADSSIVVGVFLMAIMMTLSEQDKSASSLHTPLEADDGR